GPRRCRGAALDPATDRRQCHSDARRGARGLAPPRRRRQTMGQDPSRLPGGASAVRPSLRFLLVALIGWAGVRAASLGVIPGADMFSMKAGNAQTPPAPVGATQFPEIE